MSAGSVMPHHSAACSLRLDPWRPGWTDLYYYPRGGGTAETTQWYVFVYYTFRPEEAVINSKKTGSWGETQLLTAQCCCTRPGLGVTWTSQWRRLEKMGGILVKFPWLSDWSVVIEPGQFSSGTWTWQLCPLPSPPVWGACDSGSRGWQSGLLSSDYHIVSFPSCWLRGREQVSLTLKCWPWLWGVYGTLRACGDLFIITWWPRVQFLVTCHFWLEMKNQWGKE